MSAQLLPASLREDFPVLSRRGPTGRLLIYLDSAATTLKPRPVIDAITNALTSTGGNVHRAVHLLGDEITEQFEQARRKVAAFIGAQPHETVFVRNTTEGFNLVARCLRRPGRVLLSAGEHHSGLLPWTGAVQRLPPRDDGQVDEDTMLRELGRGGVGVVFVSHASNVTGHRVNVRLLADAAHAAGAVLVLDGAQSAPHGTLDVGELGCDFLAFSSHKMCGPSGIGALFGRAELLAEMSWHLHGGGTVESVRQGQPLPREAPWRSRPALPPSRQPSASVRPSTTSSTSGPSVWKLTVASCAVMPEIGSRMCLAFGSPGRPRRTPPVRSASPSQASPRT